MIKDLWKKKIWNLLIHNLPSTKVLNIRDFSRCFNAYRNREEQMEGDKKKQYYLNAFR